MVKQAGGGEVAVRRAPSDPALDGRKNSQDLPGMPCAIFYIPKIWLCAWAICRRFHCWSPNGLFSKSHAALMVICCV